MNIKSIPYAAVTILTFIVIYVEGCGIITHMVIGKNVVKLVIIVLWS